MFRHKKTEKKKSKKKKKSSKKEKSLYEDEDGLENLDFPRRWWRQISDEDPITLEPLRSLKYPPFPLNTTNTSGEDLHSEDDHRGKGVHYFDGKALAEYLVSSSDFRNPITRGELTILDCQRLDAYLKKHRIKLDRKNITVTSVFRMASVIRKRQQQERHGNRTSETQNRRAAVALSRLIHFSSYNDNQADVVPSAAPQSQEDRPSEFRYVPAVQSDSNYRVFDDDEWIEDTRLERESFPALPTTSSAAPASSSSVHNNTNNPYSWRNRVSERRAPPGRDEFPSFPSSRGFAGHNNNSGVSSWRARISSSSNHNQRAAAPQRRRLILKPRSSNVTAVTSNTNRNDNIFGTGKARDVASEVLSDAEKRKKELERYEQALCPYSPDLLIFAKSNIQMVTSVERKLNEFLNNSTNATKYFDFPPMKLLFRSVIIAICVRI